MREVTFSSLPSGAYQDRNLVESISEDDRATLLPIIKIAFPFLKYPMLDPFSTWEADGNMGRPDGFTQMNDSHIPRMGMDRITHEHQLENLLHNLIQNDGDANEDGIMQIDDQHSPSLGIDGSTHENKVENSQYYFIQNTDGIKQMDDSHSPSSMGMDGSEHEHKTKSLQYNFILPVPSITANSIRSRQQREVEGLQLKPWHSGGVWGRACKLEKVEIPTSKVEESLLTHRAEPEASSTITDDKLSLSLASTNSETELHMNASPGMMNLRGYISQEASWMQGQRDPPFDEGSEMAHVGHFCNPSSGGSHLSRSTECGNVVDQPHERGNTRSEACIRSMPTVASKPKDGLGLAFGLPRGERVQSPSLANSINYCVAYESHEINGEPKDVIPKAVGRVKWPKFAGWHSAHFDHKRKYGSDCATEYEPRLKSRQVSGHTGDGNAKVTQVVSFLSSENTLKEHKPEQCRRSNGKQWRCSRNATSGMLYCELHYDYRRKARGTDRLPKKTAWSDIQGQKSETPDNVQAESQKEANSCSGEIRDISLKVKQLDVARCHRSDGKLWQCSREVMPGSIYCEHHYHRRCKKGKRKEVSGFAVVKKIQPDVQLPEAWNVENGINVGNRDSIGTYEQATGSKQDVNGSDQCAVRMSQVGYKGEGHVQSHPVIAGDATQEIYVPEVCGGGPMPTNIQATESKENGCGREALQPLQMGALAGGVTANYGWKCNTNQHACSGQVSLCMPSSEGKDSVSGYGQFIEESGSKQAMQAARVASHLIPWNAGCPGDTGLDSQGKESRLLERCHRKDGKKWQCSQLCKPGFVYCERHQGRLRKGRAAVSGEAKFEKPPATGAHAEGFTHQVDEEGGLANSVHGRAQVHEGLPQMNDDCPQDVAAEVHVLKQCQRKDGKGWQCSQHAKKGFSYCEHHLVYLSRRTGSKSFRKENVGLHKLATEQRKQEISTAHEPAHGCPLVAHSIQKREISSAFEPLLGSVAHPSATCSILKQEISTTHEPSLGSIVAPSIQKQDISTAHEPLLVGIASPSAAHSILKRAISIPQEPVVGSIAHPSSAHSIHEQDIGTASEPLLSCIAYATSACSIQNQEISTSHEPLLGSNAYPSAVHGVQKQGICTAYKPLLGRFAHPAASHIRKQGIYTPCEPILGSIAYPLAAHSMESCKDPKTQGPSHSVKSWSEMLTMGCGCDSDE